MNKVSANQEVERSWHSYFKKLDCAEIIKHYSQHNTEEKTTLRRKHNTSSDIAQEPRSTTWAISFPAQVPDEHRDTSSAHSNQSGSKNG